MIRVTHYNTPPTLDDGESTELLCDENGALLVSGTAGEGGIDGATATNQDEQTALLTTIDSNIAGLLADQPVYEDTTNGVAAIAWKPIDRDTYSPSNFVNNGANATLNIKGSGGNVYSVACLNREASVRYLQLWDTTTIAGTGSLIDEFVLPASNQVRVGTEYFTLSGLHFNSGLAFGYSTTSGTYTAGTAANQLTVVKYK